MPKVECYPGQLNQVFMNILNNAIDALRESSSSANFLPTDFSTDESVELADGLSAPARSSQLHFVSSSASSLGDRSVGEQKTMVRNGNSQGKKTNVPTITIRTFALDNKAICISIADNGPGMTEQVRERLFDPFFTTKPVGKGTGLGLAISYQIVVEKHRGNLKCNSVLGRGSEFIIEIPIQVKNRLLAEVRP